MELMTEFYVDCYEKKPIEAHRNEHGEIQFSETGDEMIDRWEEQIARGEIPDLNEAFDEESLKGLAKMRQKAQDRDPYQGMTIKDTNTKVARILQTSNLEQAKELGFKNLSTEKQRLLEELFEKPTFGIDLDE